MSESTTLLLVSLSHQWFGRVLSLPIIFGAATYGAGALQRHFRAVGTSLSCDDSRIYFAQRASTALRTFSLTMLIASLVIFGIAFFHIGCAAMKAHSTQCLSNIKQLATASLLYAQDYDEHLPPATRWSEVIAPHVKAAVKKNDGRGDDPFRCPATETPGSYGMNTALNRISLSDIASPADTVMLFDCDAPTRLFAGGADKLARNRHNHAPNVAFSDGHAKWANEFMQSKLNWTPTISSE